MHRLNFLAKNKEDNMRNLKIFADAIKKLGLPYSPPKLDLLSNCKFQYNIECIQWLYDYTMKINKKQMPIYNGYYRR
jgi:hypothetical protein